VTGIDDAVRRGTDLTMVSLFAGIGGFDLAAERAGVTLTAAVEIDPQAAGVLRHHWPDLALFDDVRKVTGDDLRAAGFVPERGILTGGFPCQPFSVAGRRRGMGGGDDRGELYWEISRLLADLAPRWVVLENVPGLLSIDGGRTMGTILGDLGRLGYGFAYRVLDAQHFGVAQRRRRVFVVGCLGDGARAASVLLEPEGNGGHPAPRVTAGAGVAGASRAGALTTRVGQLDDADTANLVTVGALTVPAGGGVARRGRRGRSGSRRGDVVSALTSATGGPDDNDATATGVRRLTPTECERLQGFPDGWTAVRDTDTPQADSSRYRQLGNAVAVPVVEWIMRRLVAADSDGLNEFHPDSTWNPEATS